VQLWKRGRKAKGIDQHPGKYAIISVLMPLDMYKRLVERCHLEACSLSAYCRQAIEKELHKVFPDSGFDKEEMSNYGFKKKQRKLHNEIKKKREQTR
jgi:hypothetical protein